MQQIFLWISLFGWMKNATHQQPTPRDQEWEFHPCVNLHQEKFRFLRTVRDWSLFLSHPSFGNKRVTSKDTQNSSRGRCWVFKISGKIRVVKQSLSALQYCLNSLVWCIQEIQRAKRLSQKLFFVIARASLFTDHRMSGLPMRAKCRLFSKIREHSFDNSPTDPNSSLTWW